MQTFDQVLYGCYRKDIITIESAVAYADSPNNLRLKVKTEGLQREAEVKIPAFKLRRPAKASTEQERETGQ